VDQQVRPDAPSLSTRASTLEEAVLNPPLTPQLHHALAQERFSDAHELLESL